MLVCLRLASAIGLSPLLILTLCGSKRGLVVSTELPDDLSCLTTPRVGCPGDGLLPRCIQRLTPSPCGGLPTQAPTCARRCNGGGGGVARGHACDLFAFGGAYGPLATAHYDPLLVRTCFSYVNGAPERGRGGAMVHAAGGLLQTWPVEGPPVAVGAGVGPRPRVLMWRGAAVPRTALLPQALGLLATVDLASVPLTFMNSGFSADPPVVKKGGTKRPKGAKKMTYAPDGTGPETIDFENLVSPTLEETAWVMGTTGRPPFPDVRICDVTTFDVFADPGSQWQVMPGPRLLTSAVPCVAGRAGMPWGGIGEPAASTPAWRRPPPFPFARPASVSVPRVGCCLLAPMCKPIRTSHNPPRKLGYTGKQVARGNGLASAQACTGALNRRSPPRG